MGFVSDCSSSASNTSVFLLALTAAAWNTTFGVLQEFWWFYLVPPLLSVFHLSVSIYLSLSLTHTHSPSTIYFNYIAWNCHFHPSKKYMKPYLFHLTGSASCCIYELDSMTHWGRPPRLLTTRLYCLVSALSGLRKETNILDSEIYYTSCV